MIFVDCCAIQAMPAGAEASCTSLPRRQEGPRTRKNPRKNGGCRLPASQAQAQQNWRVRSLATNQ